MKLRYGVVGCVLCLLGPVVSVVSVVSVASAAVVVGAPQAALERSSAQRVNPQAVFTVTSASATGAGSLAEAVTQANAVGAPSRVEFNLPEGASHIVLTGVIEVGPEVTIDGCTQPGSDCAAWPLTLKVEVSCDQPDGYTAFRMDGGGARLQGLAVHGCFQGAEVHGPGNAIIQSAYFGTDITGTTAVPNFYNLVLSGADGTLVGSDLDGSGDEAERVLSSGALSSGFLVAGSTGSTIAGCYIGTDVSGTLALGNSLGVYSFQSSGLEIFNSVIAGNGEGITFQTGGSGLVQGSRVGVSAQGLSLPNTTSGIKVDRQSETVLIGGLGNGQGNEIAFNVVGLLLLADTDQTVSLHRNSFHDNGGDGIEPVFANDLGDCDTGINHRQNAPDILKVSAASGQLEVTYRVDSDPACSEYPLTLEFFRPDSSGAEGQIWLGSDTYLEAEAGTVKTVSFTPSIPDEGDAYLVGTATDAGGRSSSFTFRDTDQDGYLVPEDCDDTNPFVHPGASDTAGAGGDTNCDGIEQCFVDADGDGTVAEGSPTVDSANATCTDPGEASAAAPANDCDDTDATINDGATEEAGDGVDQDCNGRELCFSDEDQDGYLPEDPSTVSSLDLDCSDPGEAFADAPGGDCDDTVEAINPDALETISDGIDSDCDGHEICVVDADGDGYRDGTLLTTSADLDCTDPGEGVLTMPVDCDDADPTSLGTQYGYADIDQDGVGQTSEILAFCGAEPPSGYVLISGDNCPQAPNPEQLDGDEDGLGDACDIAQELLPRGNGMGCSMVGGDWPSSSGRDGHGEAARAGSGRAVPISLLLLTLAIARGLKKRSARRK